MTRILVHDYPGHASPVELSRELARRGHTVLHLYAGYNQTPRGLLVPQPGDSSNFAIQGIFISKPLQKYSFLNRWLQEREYGRLLAAEIELFQPNVIISANTPLDAQQMAVRKSQAMKSIFIFWLQDVIGWGTYLILGKKIPGLGHLIGKYYIELEKKLLRESSHVVAISSDFAPWLDLIGVVKNKISVIQNWGLVDTVIPKQKNNAWARHHDLHNKFVFLYTGTLGLKHNPEPLRLLAKFFSNQQDVIICVVSEGVGADWLRQQKEKESLDNLLILNFQPFEVMSDLLASGDVLMAVLDDEAGVFSVPSKVMTYLCAQRPLLLSVPNKNLVARIVRENRLGIVSTPERAEEFIAAAQELKDNITIRHQYGQNGRCYAEQNFDIEKITDQFIGIIEHSRAN
jgi:colanic acid biosynthesis glycosyl transferase WcaI